MPREKYLYLVENVKNCYYFEAMQGIEQMFTYCLTSLSIGHIGSSLMQFNQYTVIKICGSHINGNEKKLCLKNVIEEN